jgi:hypothetical protein
MAPSKKSATKKAPSKKNPPRATRGCAGPSTAEKARAKRSLRRSSLPNSPNRRSHRQNSDPVRPHPHVVNYNRRNAKLGGPDPSAPTRRGKLSASRNRAIRGQKQQQAAEPSSPSSSPPIVPSKKKKQTGHKPCRGAGTKAPVRSSDEDSDYVNCPKPQPKLLFSLQDHSARVDKNVNQNRMSLCGLVKPPASIYDGVINFDAPLQPLFEEYKFRGNHPQWPPPSIMCCLRPPVDKDNQSLEATQFSSYRTVSSCYPFVYQDDFAIEDGEYLILCLGDTPEFCNLF